MTVGIELWRDDFNRADGASLGSEWVETGFGIASNKAVSQVADATQFAVWDNGGTANVVEQYAEADCVLGTGERVGVIVAYLDADNYVVGEWTNANGGTYQIWRVASGSGQPVGTAITGVGTTGTRNIRMKKASTTVAMYVNGERVFQEAFALSLGSGAGMLAGYTTGNASPTLDNFAVGTLPPWPYVSWQPPIAVDNFNAADGQLSVLKQYKFGSTNGTATHTVTFDATPANGNLLVAVILDRHNYGTQTSVTAGYTSRSVGQNTATGDYVEILTAIADGTTAYDSFTVTHSGTDTSTSHIYEFNLQPGTVVIEDAASSGEVTGTTGNAGTLTIANPSLVIAAVASRTTAPGASTRWNLPNNDNDVDIVTAGGDGAIGFGFKDANFQPTWTWLNSDTTLGAASVAIQATPNYWVARDWATGSKQQISSNTVQGSVGAGADARTEWRKDEHLFSNNQWAECYVNLSGDTGEEAGPTVRGGSTLDSDTYYHASWSSLNGGEYRLKKTINGTTTSLGTWPTAVGSSGNKRLRLEAIGDRIRLLVDGAEELSVIDTDHPGELDEPGIWQDYDTASSDIDGFAAGNIETSLIVDGFQYPDAQALNAQDQWAVDVLVPAGTPTSDEHPEHSANQVIDMSASGRAVAVHQGAMLDSDNQTVEMMFYGDIGNGSSEHGCLLRLQSDDPLGTTLAGYEVRAEETASGAYQAEIIRWNGDGTETVLATTTSFAETVFGDSATSPLDQYGQNRLTATISGSTITGYWNGREIITHTGDTTYTTGRFVGFHQWRKTGNTDDQIFVSRFAAWTATAHAAYTDIVQSVHRGTVDNTDTSTSVTATLDATATAGNLLVAVASWDDADDLDFSLSVQDAPNTTSWTSRGSSNEAVEYHGVQVWTKVANGDETAVTLTAASGGTGHLTVIELPSSYIYETIVLNNTDTVVTGDLSENPKLMIYGGSGRTDGVPKGWNASANFNEDAFGPATRWLCNRLAVLKQDTFGIPSVYVQDIGTSPSQRSVDASYTSGVISTFAVVVSNATGGTSLFETVTESAGLTDTVEVNLSKVISVVATSSVDGEVDLSWTDLGVPYDIERNGAVIVTGHPTNSYTDTGLSVGTGYEYRIRPNYTAYLPPQLVDGPNAGSAGSNSSTTINFTAAEGDLVVLVSECWSGVGSNVNFWTPSGYTTLVEYNGGPSTAVFAVNVKVMGPTPDTSVTTPTITGADGSEIHAWFALSHTVTVFRNVAVDMDNPSASIAVGVAPEVRKPQDCYVPDADCAVLTAVGQGGNGEPNFAAPTGWPDFATTTAVDTYRSGQATAVKVGGFTPGIVGPPAFNGTDGASSSLSLVLTPTPAPFNPQAAIEWHSLFWAEGTDFVAQGYSDTDSVTTWPNETGEADAASGTGVTYEAFNVNLGQPSVKGNGTSSSLVTADFTTDPVYTSGVSIVVIVDNVMTGDHGIVSGKNAGLRNNIRTNNGNKFTIQASGTIADTTSNFGNGAFLLVGQFDGSTGADTLTVNGVQEISTDVGSETLDGLRFFEFTDTNGDYPGSIAFVGVYEGDITADPAWPDFEAWVTSHYGITVA